MNKFHKKILFSSYFTRLLKQNLKITLDYENGEQQPPEENRTADGSIVGRRRRLETKPDNGSQLEINNSDSHIRNNNLKNNENHVDLPVKVYLLLLVYAVCAGIYSGKEQKNIMSGWIARINSFSFFSVTLIILSKPAMNEIFLVFVSHVILGTFLAIEISIFYISDSK